MDYEQKYYDLVYENKLLKNRVKDLEAELLIVNKSVKKKLNLRKEIIKEIDRYYRTKNNKKYQS